MGRVLKLVLVLRICLVTLSLFVSQAAFPVLWEEVDTASVGAPDSRPARGFSIDEMADDVDVFTYVYMQPSYDDPIVEIGHQYLTPFYSVNAFRPNRVSFTTGPQYYLTANLDWKWLRVGLAHPLADYTHGYDFRFSPSIANFQIDFSVSKIRNYRQTNNFDAFAYFDNRFDKEDDDADTSPEEQEVRLDGLETFEWKCSLEWILNKTYFSASSAFSQSYSSGQRVSAGSMLCGFAFGENRFKLNPSDSRTEEANQLLSQLPMKDNRIFNLSLGCGYGYNFVVRQGTFVIGTLMVPYLTMANSRYDLNDVPQSRVGFGGRVHGRLNCVYQYKLGFVTLAGNWHGFYLNDVDYSYFQNNFTVNVSAAFKLGEFGIRHEKIPGHQIIDFLGNLF